MNGSLMVVIFGERSLNVVWTHACLLFLPAVPGQARIRSGLREAAAQAGLSPEFCDAEEGSWKEEESAWADEPGEIIVIVAVGLVFFSYKHVRIHVPGLKPRRPDVCL